MSDTDSPSAPDAAPIGAAAAGTPRAADVPAAAADADALAARLAAIAARLDDVLAGARPADGADAPATLKAEIADVFRAVRAGSDRFAALEAEVRALAGRWKSLAARVGEDDGSGAGTAPGADGARATAPAAGGVGATGGSTAGVSRRVDHLGASTFLEKGWARLAVGAGAEAEAALRRALDLTPDAPDAVTLLAWARREQGDAAEASRLLQEVLRRGARHALARALVGRLALDAGDWEAATAHLTPVAAESRDPRARLYAHLWLGQGYLMAGAWSDATDALTRALELGPNLLEAAYDLGRAHWFAGAPAAARDAWRAAAGSNRFNPWSERCAEVLAMVEAGGEPPPVGVAPVDPDAAR